MATAGEKPDECKLIRDRSVNLKDAYRALPEYTGVLVLPANMLMVVDSDAFAVHLHSSSDGQLLAKSGTLPGQPCDVCILDGNGTRVAVTLRNGQIEILSVESTDICANIRRVMTLDVTREFEYCHGVKALGSRRELIVSGGKEDKNTQGGWISWGLISFEGHVISVNKICKSGGAGDGSASYLAISADTSTVYISCWSGPYFLDNNGVYAYEVSTGRQKFEGYKNRDLNHPMGISVDRRRYIYVCNMLPPCIHQLTERMEPVTIHRQGMPPQPIAMYCKELQEELYVTSMKSKEVWILRPQWFDRQVMSIKMSGEKLNGTNEEQHLVLGQLSVPSSEEVVWLWAKKNGINDGAVGELLKEGYTSVEALILLTPNDLVTTKIPRGQQKLIIESVKHLIGTDTAQVQSIYSETTSISSVQDSHNCGRSTTRQSTAMLTESVFSTSQQPITSLSIGIEDPYNHAVDNMIPDSASVGFTSVLSTQGYVQDRSLQSSCDSGMDTHLWQDTKTHRKSGAPSIPMEILNMDDRSIKLFEEALKSGKDTVYNIKIMVVGHVGVGKTTLIKRLIGENVNISDRQSTEGIDVHVNCCDVSLSTLEWRPRTKDSEQDYRLHRLARVLSEQQSKVANKAQAENLPQEKRTDSNASVADKEEFIIPPQEVKALNSNEGVHVAVEERDTEVLYCRSPLQEFGQNLSSNASQEDPSNTDLVQRNLSQSETSMRAMLKLLQENADRLKHITSKTVPLTILDFAGQYAFYTSHQTFLTRRAIYLLVSDVSRDISDFVPDEFYFDSQGVIKCRVHELNEVWLNSIHCCASSSEARIPAVILVGTHVDKISQKWSPAKQIESNTETTMSETADFTQPTISIPATAAMNKQPMALTLFRSVMKVFKPHGSKGIVSETPVSSITGTHALSVQDQHKKQKKSFLSAFRKEKHVKLDIMAAPSTVKSVEKKNEVADARKRYCHEICEKYFKEMRSYLQDKPTRFHLVDKDFAIDNTVVDSSLEELKRKIVEVASQQPYWGEEIPARWLPLEQELMKLKAAGIKVIPRILLEHLNEAVAVRIETEEELDLFLRYHHDIGTVLYISTEALKSKIVLDPQWMIDALKSLITSEMFVLRCAPAVAGKWLSFKMSGKLSQELIDAIWTKEKNPDLHDNKEHILLLMESLNIIARPRCYSEDGSEIKEEEFFLAPCMLRQRTPRDILFPESYPHLESSSVLCYLFRGKFLPPPIFHRFLASCMAHWPIAKKDSEYLIYCGSCVFNLDLQHRLIMFCREHVIFLRVTRMGTTEKAPSYKLCIEVREFITITLSKIIGYFGQSLQFELCIQCPKVDGDRVDCLIPVAVLQENEEVCCDFHDNSHVIMSHDVLKLWFQEVEYSDATYSAGPMPLVPASDTDRFMHITYLLVDVGSRVLRHLLHHHTVTATCTLDQYLAKYMSVINNLTRRRMINSSQMDIMFPPNGDDTNLDDYDITLLSVLFNNIVPTLSQQEKDMIKSLREERNKLYGHAKSCKIIASDFQTYWNDISSTLITLSQQCGDAAFEGKILQEIQCTQISAIPTGSYLDILKLWFDKIETVKDELQNVTSRLQALEFMGEPSAGES